MGQGAVELGRDSDLPGDVHKPVDMKVPNSAEAKVSLVGGIAHANESMGQALEFGKFQLQVKVRNSKEKPATGWFQTSLQANGVNKEWWNYIPRTLFTGNPNQAEIDAVMKVIETARNSF